jgi:cytochrome c oxidase subunit 2
VRVVSAADYQAWLGGQVAAIPQDPVASGQKWAEQNGCLGCHSLDGTALIGPTFKGLYGKTEYFEDGSSRLVDDAYLLEAIRDPQASIVKGYPPIMQASSAAGLTDEQIQDIIALIQSLK